MITYQRLLEEMEEYVIKAKNAKDDREFRELLSGIRAMCDVVLNEKQRAQAVRKELPPASGEPLLSPVKIEDEDANGDSIFDF
ncbi:YwdI family protein [Ureibacillus sp. FSL K6-8385]|uniref:Uncharacterized protein n=1 Tax=Ureibacillus terrenus TaxID=118246 RepID=A0A540V261_9BACL|nr:YwdI family protein [Ureibacillus terrenus]MED3661321.1 YwdI family protein [Ureibacillus terrenus]MED3764207.1 YwdI family protein [Ureibacillus terrenus]TQE90842.1 hypothetical protein FKZ59_07480 [Ureibacillus terrenus]